MPTKIVVDGYNLMLVGQSLRRDMLRDLEKAREGLLNKLAGYKKITTNKITVVFDGSSEGEIYRRKTKFAGIDVVFSRPPQKADDVIRNAAGKSGGNLIVVTSDNDLARSVENAGCATISSPEFMEKIEYAALAELKGDTGEEDYAERPSGTKKKGNPRRPSKKERKRKARLKKL
jgi:predicted RNA-binding protein with PIN domain